MSKKFNLVALIPARSGSKRLKNKNILKLNKKPLIAHTINYAKKAKIFNTIILSTNSKKYAKIGKKYGAEVPFLRPIKFSSSTSPDYSWVNFTIKKLEASGKKFTHFFILRPTNPFRTDKVILKAWKKFQKYNPESLRAVSICKEHPFKMWSIVNKFIKPILKKKILKQPAFNCQYQSLPKIYIQNASLEISRTEVLKKYKTITGRKIIPFFSDKLSSIDINYKEDFVRAKKMFKKK